VPGLPSLSFSSLSFIKLYGLPRSDNLLLPASLLAMLYSLSNFFTTLQVDSWQDPVSGESSLASDGCPGIDWAVGSRTVSAYSSSMYKVESIDLTFAGR
jgi:hypothetical protein